MYISWKNTRNVMKFSKFSFQFFPVKRIQTTDTLYRLSETWKTPIETDTNWVGRMRSETFRVAYYPKFKNSEIVYSPREIACGRPDTCVATRRLRFRWIQSGGLRCSGRVRFTFRPRTGLPPSLLPRVLAKFTPDTSEY